jgi:hypothetical protein
VADTLAYGLESLQETSSKRTCPTTWSTTCSSRSRATTVGSRPTARTTGSSPSRASSRPRRGRARRACTACPRITPASSGHRTLRPRSTRC